MRNSMIALTMTAVLAAGAAGAQSITAGTAQLTAQIGVDASQYSSGEIAAMWANARDNNFAGNKVMSEPKELGYVNAGTAQLAAQAGVAPGTLSAGELEAVIEQGRKYGPRAEAKLIAAKTTPSERPEISAGQAQLAAQLGVNPADYTVAELTALRAQVFDGDK